MSKPANPATGLGWEDHRNTPAEMADMADKVGQQQLKVASFAGSPLAGSIGRGQHQKRVLGAMGRLRLNGNFPAAMKVGAFAATSVAVACRFSNGQPCPFSDQKADVRGVALKYFTPAGVEADLLATNEGGRSHAVDGPKFVAYADILAAKIADGAVGAFQMVIEEIRKGALTAVELATISALLVKDVALHNVHSLALERFWGSAVALGGVAFKYSLVGEGESRLEGFDDSGDNFLRDELVRRLEARGPLKWTLMAQLFVDEGLTPVNDAAKVWTSDDIVIGELEISSLLDEADEKRIDQMAFNPGNGFDALGITHARQEVYAASARNRADRGLLSPAQAREFIEAVGSR